MVHPFRSALLVVAALSASSVAPAQVGPVSVAPEPLMTGGTSDMSTMVVPAALANPEIPVPGPSITLDPPAIEADEPDADTAERPTGDLASMVEQLRSSDPGSSELECLAGAIYFESKSESLQGQLAVGHVIANRAESGRFPSSYCGVLFQRGQFSFVRGRSLPHVPRASRDWQEAVAIAKIVDQNLRPSPVGKAMFFHARRVSPGWRLTRVATLGNHIFYR